VKLWVGAIIALAAVVASTSTLPSASAVSVQSRVIDRTLSCSVAGRARIFVAQSCVRE
jgi:hypothetical protein